ncbi:MAG: DUF4215 domain-containing protein [Streptococcus sp.]|nr:DUF4215 domain-containing protein [Streptococcus sp.]
MRGSEACDDGNLIDGDGCSGLCTIEAGWSCSFTYAPTGDNTICLPICGDGKRVGNEYCDDGV